MYIQKFELSEKEQKRFNEWREAKGGDPYCGAAGGAYSYIFTPTGLGTIVTVTCVDKTEIDLTDWDNW